MLHLARNLLKNILSVNGVAFFEESTKVLRRTDTILTGCYEMIAIEFINAFTRMLRPPLKDSNENNQHTAFLHI
jgi:hypothetical protein